MTSKEKRPTIVKRDRSLPTLSVNERRVLSGQTAQTAKRGTWPKQGVTRPEAGARVAGGRSSDSNPTGYNVQQGAILLLQVYRLISP